MIDKNDLSIFNKNVEFIAGADKVDRIPETNEPEIAFAGRSNVGKSSLINALVSRKALARVSHTPGRTQQLNFFRLDDKMIITDMPGYGYAKVSKTMRSDWEVLLKKYCQGRTQLKRVYVLIDSRRGIADSDRNMMKLLDEAGQSYQLVLTKVDKEKSYQKVIEECQNEHLKHLAMHPIVLATSSFKKHGLDELKQNILNII